MIISVVAGTRGGHRLERGLDVDWQARRAALIGLERVAEAAVVVLVAAQGVDHVRRWLAKEGSGEEAPLK